MENEAAIRGILGLLRLLEGALKRPAMYFGSADDYHRAFIFTRSIWMGADAFLPTNSLIRQLRWEAWGQINQSKGWLGADHGTTWMQRVGLADSEIVLEWLRAEIKAWKMTLIGLRKSGSVRDIRPEIAPLENLGPLPGSESTLREEAPDAEYERLLRAVPPPVTDDEAAALLLLLSDGGSSGLAWTVIHLAETAPGWPVATGVPMDAIFDINEGPKPRYIGPLTDVVRALPFDWRVVLEERITDSAAGQ